MDINIHQYCNDNYLKVMGMLTGFQGIKLYTLNTDNPCQIYVKKNFFWTASKTPQKEYLLAKKLSKTLSVYNHTTLNLPNPVLSQKLSRVGPGTSLGWNKPQGKQ